MVDKSQLYPTYNRSARRRDDLNEEIVRKSLDMGVDPDMQIDNRKEIDNRKGVNGWQLVAMAAVVAVGLLGWRLTQPTPPPVPSVSPAVPGEPVEYEVTFWADDGTKLETEGP